MFADVGDAASQKQSAERLNEGQKHRTEGTDGRHLQAQPWLKTHRELDLVSGSPKML